MNFRRLLMEIRELFTGRCMFDDKCEHYRVDSVTCNSQAGSYCGKYRWFVNNI